MAIGKLVVHGLQVLLVGGLDLAVLGRSMNCMSAPRALSAAMTCCGGVRVEVRFSTA
jgi:hypothetical protein